jgi:hypothetical protein
MEDLEGSRKKEAEEDFNTTNHTRDRKWIESIAVCPVKRLPVFNRGRKFIEATTKKVAIKTTCPTIGIYCMLY